MSDLERNKYRGVTDAQMQVLSVERLYNHFLRRRSIIDTLSMSGLVLVVVALVVLSVLTWVHVLPWAALGPAYIAIAALTVVALSARGVALWRYSVMAARTADRVREMRRELEVAGMAPTPMDLSREKSVELLAAADLNTSILLEDARDTYEQIWEVVLSSNARPDTGDPAWAMPEWTEVKEGLDDAYDAAASLLRHEWSEASAELRRADKRAVALLEQSRPDVGAHSVRVVTLSARLLDRANTAARERLLKAHRSAAALLDQAQEDAARRLGLVRRPAPESGHTESAGERE